MNEVGVWVAVFIINFVVFLLGYFIGQVHLRYMQMRDEYIQLMIDKKNIQVQKSLFEEQLH
jgi:predicted Na+-dependent transporter|tara:strand:+ start:326 stop:508 length:183 start_codon:yes stop_codon:yes gene_type:complete